MTATAAQELTGAETLGETRGRVLTLRMHRLLLLLAVLAAIAGSDLYLATQATDRYFAWTIQSHLTAAALGGAYLASLVLLLLSARTSEWAVARIGAISAQTLIALILFAMLVHIDRFHTGSDDPITFFATWSFIGTYVVVPPLVLLGLVAQVRTRGDEAPRVERLPSWFLLGLAMQGVVLVALGAALVVSPTAADAAWPWSLTPLTGRAVGAFLVAIGVGLLLGVRENDWHRIRPALVAYAVLGVLELIAVLRYSGELSGDSVGTWLYVGSLGVVLTTGAYGIVRILRARPMSLGFRASR